MFRSKNLVKVFSMSVEAVDAYFDITVEKIIEKVHAMDLEPMCDAYNVYTKDTGKVRVTVTPTNRFHNYFEDYKTLAVDINKDLARKIVKHILDNNENKMWFVKDQLSYAAKHGELI